MDKNWEIKNIWSNIGENDGLYAIKIFDYKSKKEMSAGKELLDNYENIMTKRKIFSPALISEKSSEIFFTSLTIEFTKNDGRLEEIRTIV